MIYVTSKRDQARRAYQSGMKYKDISDKFDIPIGTLKSWRAREGWKRDATASKKVQPKRKKDAPRVAPKIVDELEANDELTDKQKSFCLFYLQRFNATWAYQQAYQCTYETAMSEGSKCLRNPKIKRQLAELKKQQRADLYVTAEDIANEYAKQAFASLGDVLDYKVHKELITDADGSATLDAEGKPVEKHVADIFLKPSDQIDWSLVEDIHKGKDGLMVKLYDKQKALNSLAKIMQETDVDKQSATVIIKDDIEGDEQDGATDKVEK